MTATIISLKCGHKITVDLPEDIKLRAKIIENYHNQDCLECRRQQNILLAKEKQQRMLKIQKLCKPLSDENEKLKQQAARIRLDKLSSLDDMFDKLARHHAFANKQETTVFTYYRQRAIMRLCSQNDIHWWLDRRNIPVESIVDELKEETIVADGKIIRPLKDDDPAT